MAHLRDQLPSVRRLPELLLEHGASFLAHACVVLIVFALSWLLAGWLQRAIVRSFGAAHADATLVRFVASAARYGLIVVALVSCLSAFGITSTSFAAVIGAAGIAIGLAFQGTLSNLAAGLVLLLFRPFRVGDTIRAGEYSGTVKALELFSTVLVTPDNRRVVLPNSTLSNQALENVTYFPTRRADVEVPFPLRTSAEAVLASLVERASRLPQVHAQPPVEARIAGFQANLMKVVLSAWCDTEHHASVVAALALVGKLVRDEARVRPALTPQTPPGDAVER